jgi:hypothetical protein
MSFDPTAARDPLAGFRLINSLLYAGEKIFQVSHAFQVQRHLALADAGQMSVRVGESGNHRLSTKVDHSRFRSAIGLGFGVRAGENDQPVANGDRFGARLRFVDGIDIAVQQQ